MRAKAMHENTKRLPLIQVKEKQPTLGNSTETSLQSGVFNGTIAELEGMIYNYLKQFPGLQTVIGGGGFYSFGRSHENGIFARPNLTEEGLYTILEYHVKNHLL